MIVPTHLCKTTRIECLSLLLPCQGMVLRLYLLWCECLCFHQDRWCLLLQVEQVSNYFLIVLYRVPRTHAVGTQWLSGYMPVFLRTSVSEQLSSISNSFVLVFRNCTFHKRNSLVEQPKTLKKSLNVESLASHPFPTCTHWKLLKAYRFFIIPCTFEYYYLC